jgi:hypothetical protein
MKRNNKVIIFLSLALSIFFISPSYANGETLYCQGMVCTTTPPTPATNPVATFAVVDENNKVVNIIAGSLNYFGNNDKTVSNHPGCSDGCKIILQAPSDPGSFNTAGYTSSGSVVVTHNPVANTFDVKDADVLTKTITAPEITQNDSGTVVTTLSVDFGAITESGDISATISGKEIINNSESLVTEQSIFFEKSETEETVRTAASRLSILSARIERILNILNGWLS